MSPRARAPRPLLVLAAHAPELAALGPALARAPRLVTTAVVGIGAVDAAAGAARAIAEVRPARIVLVGTAGAYAHAPWAVGAVVVIRRMKLASLTVAQDRAYLPRLMAASTACDPELRTQLVQATGLPTGDVACPLGITRTRAAARILAEATGAALENLEAFSVARAALSAGVPFAAVLGITNKVGPKAHEEWRANARAAAASACEAVARWIAVEAGDSI